MNDQPIISIATFCKTAPGAAPAGFHASHSQDELATEMQWWEHALRRSTSSYGDEEPLHCYTWPPRSYSCTFCRRMFTSAQALGGHMNVHRHERARLREFSQPAAAIPTTSFTAPSTVPLPAFYMQNNMPCFNYNISNPPSSKPNISSPSLQQGIQATRKIGEERREKLNILLKERRDEEMHAAQFLIDNQNKQEVACVDLELRLGSLASA